ncbi:MAG: branched-chain alpha-keto acid dehydrogenase subunit E2, partial [Chitinivibrionales bacterium]|nr:branched-chain alpha-keto acid dehydrogenase subunit E2 [Chitinivibrionales bacterium]
MVKDIKLPEIAENVESGDIVRILIAQGDYVQKEQPIMELETDKAGFELPSPEEGTVTEIDVQKGDTVSVGQLLLKVDTDHHAEEEAEKAPEPRREAEEEAAAGGAQAEAQGERRAEPEKPPEREEAPSAEEAEKPQAEERTRAAEPISQAPPPAAPSVRRLARELGVDIAAVEGTAPGGRISAEDVKRHVQQRMAGERGRYAPEQPSLPDFSAWGQTERESMSKVRTITAEGIQSSWGVTPHVTHADKADITTLEQFRQQFSQKASHNGVKLTVTAVLVKVVASALHSFPKFNASIDMDKKEIVYKKYVNVGVAVDTDRGLLVPVIRDADRKNVLEIARELGDLARRAREKKISPDEMKGGNFTVSNLGGIGGTLFTPVIYHPQVAILGVARAQNECVMRDGTVQGRMMLPLCLSYDHRLIDGADGARFMRWI